MTMRLNRRRVDCFCLSGIQIAKYVLSPRASITSSNIFFFRRRKKTFFGGPWGKCYDTCFIIDNIPKIKYKVMILNDLSILIFHTTEWIPGGVFSPCRAIPHSGWACLLWAFNVDNGSECISCWSKKSMEGGMEMVRFSSFEPIDDVDMDYVQDKRKSPQYPCMCISYLGIMNRCWNVVVPLTKYVRMG